MRCAECEEKPGTVQHAWIMETRVQCSVQSAWRNPIDRSVLCAKRSAKDCSVQGLWKNMWSALCKEKMNVAACRMQGACRGQRAGHMERHRSAVCGAHGKDMYSAVCRVQGSEQGHWLPHCTLPLACSDQHNQYLLFHLPILYLL